MSSLVDLPFVIQKFDALNAAALGKHVVFIGKQNVGISYLTKYIFPVGADSCGNVNYGTPVVATKSSLMVDVKQLGG